MILDVPEITAEMEALGNKAVANLALSPAQTLEEYLIDRVIGMVNSIVADFHASQMKEDATYKNAVLSALTTQANK